MSPSGQAPQTAIMVGTFPMAPGQTFELHTHPAHQLAWAASGVLIATAEAATWVLPPTRALWIPATVPHQVVASGRAQMRALYIRVDRCPIRWQHAHPVAAGPLLAELVHHLADHELDDEKRARAEAVLMDQLEPVESATIVAPRPADERAADVADLLLANPADQRNLDEWGHAVGASARTLARAFVADTGLPFGRWRTAVRLQAALPHLAAGESVAAVAHQVGYGTPSAFVAAFRRETGFTPGAYFRTEDA